MVHDPASTAAHASPSDTRLRTLMGSISVLTMVMTVPQVLTIWLGHQRSRRFTPDMEHVSAVCHALVLVRDTATRLEHLPAVRRLDDTGRGRDRRSRRLWIAPSLRHIPKGGEGSSPETG